MNGVSFAVEAARCYTKALVLLARHASFARPARLLRLRSLATRPNRIRLWEVFAVVIGALIAFALPAATVPPRAWIRRRR